jgi:glycosyltransferase involved in cell wall biosynthesis
VTSVGSSSGSISVVMPTYNREAALAVTLPQLLRLESVSEFVIVIDGSHDGSREFVEGLGDERLRLLENLHNVGAPASRNRGLAAATGDWILLVDDDRWVPSDHAVKLRERALAVSADIIAGPWIHAITPEDRERANGVAQRRPASRFDLYTHPGTYPQRDMETPFIDSVMLLRQEVASRVSFDARLGGNAWREETSFVLQATREGFRPFVTGASATFQGGHWKGGNKRRRLEVEYWLVRNNWRFLRVQREALKGYGYTSPPLVEELRFVLRRLADLMSGWVRHRGRRLVGRR